MIATTRFFTTDDLVDNTHSEVYDDVDSDDIEWEEWEIPYKDKKLKLSVPKGSLDYDPRQKVPLYCPAVRVDNGRVR